MKLNEKGKVLRKCWNNLYYEEVERREEMNQWVDGFCILDNYGFLKNITDECGWLIATNPEEFENAIHFVISWGWHKECKDDRCLIPYEFTCGDVYEELKKYYDFEDKDYYLCEKYGIEPW
jgi:hypothetical protein